MAGKKGVFKEFIEFINRGSVFDLAIGVIIGGALTSVVTSLVDNVISPIISFFTGGSKDVPGMSVTLGGNVIDFGAFLSAVINFLIMALVVFLMVKLVKSVTERGKKLKGGADDEAAPAPRKCPYCGEVIADDATRCPHCTTKLEGYAGPED